MMAHMNAQPHGQVYTLSANQAVIPPFVLQTKKRVALRASHTVVNVCNQAHRNEP